MQRLLLAMIFCFGGAALFAAPPAANPGSAFGVCAHLSGDRMAPQKLALMRTMGIRWARADFNWGSADKDDGTWSFEEFDTLVAEAEKNGIALLPILSQEGSRKPTTEPKNFERWKEYVRRTVTRYKDRLRYWEIINEPNLDMLWGPELPGGDYAKLLDAAYKIIKEIDPNLIVVHGGLAGTPRGYLSDEFSAVPDDFFDVMNVHCYRGGMRTLESIGWFEHDLNGVFQTLQKAGRGDKPLWITETGWASLPNFGEMYRNIVGFAYTAFSEGKPISCGYLYDEKYAPSLFYLPESLERMFPEGTEPKKLSLDDLATLSPATCRFLLLPPGEAFPSPCYDALVDYVKNGGVAVLLGGIPFRYEVERNADGIWTAKTEEADPKFREQFCLDVSSHGADAAVPNIALLRVAPAVESMLTSVTRTLIDGFGDTYQTTRFLSDRLFDKADSATVLMTAERDGFSAPAVAIVQPHGFKGALVAGTANELETTNICTVENQAVYLPQNFLIARCAGVEKVFIYEFQSPEIGNIDKEHHFGLTHADLTPKPAFTAYKTLIAVMPDGLSAPTKRIVGDAVVVEWTRPDGTNVYALWTPDGETVLPVQIKGKVDRAVDYLGKNVSVDSQTKTLTLSPKILYLVGPEAIL